MQTHLKVCHYHCRSLFRDASRATSGPIWYPFWGPNTDSEESKNSQDGSAVENAAKSQISASLRQGLSFGFSSGPKCGPAEAKDAVLQAKSQPAKKMVKNGPEKRYET